MPKRIATGLPVPSPNVKVDPPAVVGSSALLGVYPLARIMTRSSHGSQCRNCVILKLFGLPQCTAALRCRYGSFDSRHTSYAAAMRP
jgi:hypothetical protein